MKSRLVVTNELGGQWGIRTMTRKRLLLMFSSLLWAGLVFAQATPDKAASGTLMVRGDVSTPLSLTAADLEKMPRQTVSVSDQDGTKVSYVGVLLREVLQRAGAPLGKQLRGKALSTYVLAKAHDGYQVVFTLAEVDSAFADESILIADKRDGKALFGYQGPMRLICANDKAGARSVRMLEVLEVVQLQK
jgi:DMSO/TMAO reductase YedYZ molybdopterin-dependent catalytic subunit